MWDVKILDLDLFSGVLAYFAGINCADALISHGAVGEPESLSGLGIVLEQIQPVTDAPQRPAAEFQGRTCCLEIRG